MKGCVKDTDGDGDCPDHPDGCPPWTRRYEPGEDVWYATGSGPYLTVMSSARRNWVTGLIRRADAERIVEAVNPTFLNANDLPRHCVNSAMQEPCAGQCEGCTQANLSVSEERQLRDELNDAQFLSKMVCACDGGGGGFHIRGKHCTSGRVDE